MIYVERLQHEVLKAMSYVQHYNDADGNMYYKMQITTKKLSINQVIFMLTLKQYIMKYHQKI